MIRFLLAAFFVFFYSFYSFALQYSFGTKIGGHRVATALELGIRKSFIDFQFDFKKREPRNLVDMSEGDLYLEMFKKSLLPGYIVFEATSYPYYHLGTYLHEDHTSFYDHFTLFDLSETLNLIRVTAGGEEKPYVFSLFFGEVIPFSRVVGTTNIKKKDQVGYALSGWIIDYSNRREQNFFSRQDNWFDVLYKVKGSKTFQDETISWRFEIGPMFHDNREFIDAVTLFLMREHQFNKKADKTGNFFWTDVRYQYQWHIASSDYRSPLNIFTLQKIEAYKFFPKIYTGFMLGFRYDRFRAYDASDNFVKYNGEYSVYLAPTFVF